MPLTGLLNAAAAGHPVSFFGLFTMPRFFAGDPRLSQIAVAVHLACQFIVYVLVAVHVAVVLMQRFVRRNRILARMLPLRRLG